MSGSVGSGAARRSRGSLLIGLVAILAGIGLAYLAWVPIAEVHQLAADGVRTEARVGTVQEQRRRSGASYYPVFIFRTSDGRVVRERSAVAVAAPEPYLGRTVTVVYDAGNPANTNRLNS